MSPSPAAARPIREIDLVATSDIEGVEVGIIVTGRANNPQIAFTSSPRLPQDEVVARILFGSSVTEISALQAVQLAASLNSLRGGGGGLNPLGRLRSATGIDRLRLVDADSATGRGTAVAAGMYLSDDIYVEIITDAKGFTATQLEISLSRTLEPALAIRLEQRHQRQHPLQSGLLTGVVAAISRMVPRGGIEPPTP